MAKRKVKRRAEKKEAPAKDKRGVGRPSEYKPEYAEQARKFCLLGATDKQLAEMFEVSEQTINAWKKQHPEFLESIKKGKDVADAEVAESLYHRARGYEHPAVKIFGDTKTGSALRVPYVERYPPDTMAGIYWMNNRRRENWKQRHDHEVSGPNKGPIKTESKVKMTPDQAYLAMLGKR